MAMMGGSGSKTPGADDALLMLRMASEPGKFQERINEIVKREAAAQEAEAKYAAVLAEVQEERRLAEEAGTVNAARIAEIDAKGAKLAQDRAEFEKHMVGASDALKAGQNRLVEERRAFQASITERRAEVEQREQALGAAEDALAEKEALAASTFEAAQKARSDAADALAEAQEIRDRAKRIAALLNEETA